MTEPLLEVENLSKSFRVRRGFLGGSAGTVHALSDISFSVEAGEAFGLVGESGCGKSTAGRSILRDALPIFTAASRLPGCGCITACTSCSPL